MRKLTKYPTIALTMLATLLAADCSSAGAQQPAHIRYKLRSGDTLNLQYRLTPDLNQTVVVQPDGYVSLNVAGEIQVGGLSVTEAHDLIVKADEKRLNNPELNLILEEFTRPAVVVAGEVFRPGQIELKEHTSALGAVLLAGGFTQTAQTGQVLVFRKMNEEVAEVTKLDLARIRTNADLKRDFALQAGDMIFVPRDKIANIDRYIKLVNTGVFFNPLQFIQ